MAKTPEIQTLAQVRSSLPIKLLLARESVMDRFRPMLFRHDITEQQWRVMRVLREAEMLDASELAQRAAILGPSLSRILKALTARGFLAMCKDPEDGRRTLVSLTEAGFAFLDEAAPESTAIYAEIEALVGRERIVNLMAELDELIEKLS